MLILTWLNSRGQVVMDHGTPVSLSVINDNEAGLTFLKNRMAILAHENPDTNYAIVRPAYQIIQRTGEPQHPCGT